MHAHHTFCGDGSADLGAIKVHARRQAFRIEDHLMLAHLLGVDEGGAFTT